MREYYKILSVENKFDVTNLVENIFEYLNVFFSYSPLTPDIAIIIRSKKIIYFVHGLFLFLQLQKSPVLCGRDGKAGDVRVGRAHGDSLQLVLCVSS